MIIDPSKITPNNGSEVYKNSIPRAQNGMG